MNRGLWRTFAVSMAAAGAEDVGRAKSGDRAALGAWQAEVDAAWGQFGTDWPWTVSALLANVAA